MSAIPQGSGYKIGIRTVSSEYKPDVYRGGMVLHVKRMIRLSLFIGALFVLSCLFRQRIASAEEATSLEEEVASLQERVEALEKELESTKKKSQTWKNMYYSLKAQYDALTGAEATAVDAGGQEKAEVVRDALSIIGSGGYSRREVISQLQEKGHSSEDAAFGADNCGADWKSQAARRGNSLLSSTTFSLDGLISQLLLLGFTQEEAEAGANMAYENQETTEEITASMENALREAQNVLSGNDFYSYSGMIQKLRGAGYSEEEATYAADNCGADWKDQARRQASFLLLYQNMNHDELIKALLAQGFTEEEAEYGYNQNGL